MVAARQSPAFPRFFTLEHRMYPGTRTTIGVRHALACRRPGGGSRCWRSGAVAGSPTPGGPGTPGLRNSSRPPGHVNPRRWRCRPAEKPRKAQRRAAEAWTRSLLRSRQVLRPTASPATMVPGNSRSVSPCRSGFRANAAAAARSRRPRRPPSKAAPRPLACAAGRGGPANLVGLAACRRRCRDRARPARQRTQARR